MEIKVYRASSVQEALQLVREDLGPKAVVLETRQVQAGGFLGLWRRNTLLEVTATNDAGRAFWSPQEGPMDHGIDLSEQLPFNPSTKAA
jgi:flagellar biosynthesis protein FlhF